MIIGLCLSVFGVLLDSLGGSTGGNPWGNSRGSPEILGRFWVDSWLILGRLKVVSLMTLGRFGVGSRSNLAASLAFLPRCRALQVYMLGVS